MSQDEYLYPAAGLKIPGPPIPKEGPEEIFLV